LSDAPKLVDIPVAGGKLRGGRELAGRLDVRWSAKRDKPALIRANEFDLDRLGSRDE